MKQLLILVCLFAGIKSSAQLKGFSAGPFVEAGWPTGNFQQSNKNGYGAGFGADIRLGKIGLTDLLGICISEVKRSIRERVW